MDETKTTTDHAAPRPADAYDSREQPPETAEHFEHTIKRLIATRNARRSGSDAPYR